jgi:sulfatase maturation enzyme AslB (radical SAM superfamily)
VDEVTSHVIDGLRGGEGIDEIKRRYTKKEDIDPIIEELMLAGFFKEKEESSPSLPPKLDGREEISIIVLNVAQDCNLRCRYC